MKRREFLAAGVTMTGALTAKRFGLLQPPTRAAVVVGIDQVGDLPKLRAAASGAMAMSAWLNKEGFDVTPLTDANGPVRFTDFFNAVKKHADNPTLTQLVIYFAGHGFVNSYSEHWLLSEAPDNPNEAVSLNESVYLARLSSIPNVVFISDACRSRADSIRTERVSGSVLFPNARSTPNTPADVDQFLATLVGDPSWEVPVTESTHAFEGIYTGCFLDAFKRPDAAMVRTVGGRAVVPNNSLKPYLAREVPKRAQAASITLKQRPDSQVVSGDATFIGHVLTDERATTAAPVTATIADVANAALRQAGATNISAPRPGITDAMLSTESQKSGFGQASSLLIQARGLPLQLSARTGFTISGTRIASVVVHPRFKAEQFNSTASPRPEGRVEVTMSNTAATSVAIRFEDGTGTVIAALDEYIANVVVDAHGVSEVSYVPSRQSPMRSDYEREGNRLEQLRVAVATAARFGVFRFDGPREQRQRAAAEMADRIRVLKGIDPTLGLYASYAYADASLPNQVNSVRQYMRMSLSAELFDVVMLSGELSGQPIQAVQGLAPFCPMLSQGWSLLRVLNIRLPESIAAARGHLRPSLWTTFDDEGMTIIETALREGRVN